MSELGEGIPRSTFYRALNKAVDDGLAACREYRREPCCSTFNHTTDNEDPS